ncbi:MAG: hypothetical protein EPO11_05685 [Gammaproteobacteria bacterium]|nr:MAG: hypothetical protein EPO11_05685 [Gammaproteobacteria bacterium]
MVAKNQKALIKKLKEQVRQMLKSIEAKAHMLKSAIRKAEKKHIAKLTKSIAKKGKKVKKSRKKK